MTQYSAAQLKAALGEVCAQRDAAQARLVSLSLEVALLREIVQAGTVAMTENGKEREEKCSG